MFALRDRIMVAVVSWGEAEWTARDVRPRRTLIDGLSWCAECHRAIDRGWLHDQGCPVACVDGAVQVVELVEERHSRAPAPVVVRSALAARLVEQQGREQTA